MPLTSKITPYKPEWPALYEEEASRLIGIFGSALITLHHVGSTAVRGLLAKPEIDMLAVIGDQVDAKTWTADLARLGYKRGHDLSDGHLFYKRDVGGVRTHKLHVCLEGHEKAEQMLRFRDLLRSDSELCERYGTLKLKLEGNNRNGIGEYLAGKEPFIHSALKTADKNIGMGLKESE